MNKEADGFKNRMHELKQSNKQLRQRLANIQKQVEHVLDDYWKEYRFNERNNDSLLPLLKQKLKGVFERA